MNPIDIGKSYNSITHLWNDDEFDRSNGISQHVKAIAFVESRGHALDVGCGSTGRFIDLLLEHRFSPEGIDVSDNMVVLARERHPAINFYNADVCQWVPERHYDFVSAWDSIWHVPLDQQESVITKLIAHLNVNGVLIFSCGGTDKVDEHKDDSMGPEIYYSTLGVTGFMRLFMKLSCVCRHFEYDQYPELHSYFIVQKI